MEWISVKDRLPKHGELVIVFNANKDYLNGIFVSYIERHGNWRGPFDDFEDLITHWMPLPEPPMEWISVRDRLPLENELVAILSKCSGVNTGSWHTYLGRPSIDEFQDCCPLIPEYWQRLPKD